MSSGIDEIGDINWHLLLCLFGAWIIVTVCIIKGVKSVGKVVYVTAILPYILLTIILIRGLTLDGSVNGIIMYLRPDFSRLTDLQVWIEAGLQVFYSLGPGWGQLISMASYNRFDNNVLRDSLLLGILGEGTSLYSGFVIFTVLGFMAHKLSLPLDKIVKSGPGLGFIAYPESLTHLPGQNFWSCLFFIMLLSVGLDSMFAHCETIVGVLTDSFSILRQRRSLFTACFCFVCFLLGIILCTQGGIYIFQLLDWYIATFSLTTVCLIECLIFGWIYGLERFSQDVNLMIGRGIPIFYRFCIGYITPIILLGLNISSFYGFKPVTYGHYSYPKYAEVLGIMISILPLVPVVGFAIHGIWKAEGYTFLQKLRNATKPSVKWMPVCQDIRDYDNHKDRINSSNL